MGNKEKAADAGSYEDVGGLGIEYLISRVSEFAREMWQYYILFFVVLFLCVLFWIFIYIFGKQTYTATAIIGPPNPSPTNVLISSMGTVGKGLGKVLGGLGAGGSSSSDQFEEYQYLLKSPRMAIELAKNKDFMHAVFSQRWNKEKKAWKPPGLGRFLFGSVAQLINRPIAEYPDTEMLNKYLKRYFGVSQVLSSSTSSLVSLGSGFLSISLASDNPQKAERLLDTILTTADDIIRHEQYRDVTARISYIKSEMPNISQTDQKESLIQILAHQEELKVMMVADKRFSYVLISVPYASPIPTSPISPDKALLISILISLAILAILVFFEPRSSFLRRNMLRFRRPRTNKGAG